MEYEISPGEQGEWIRRKSLREGVFDLLHQRIVAGKCSPGEWLRQEEIASRLGVSQTPVREALDLLVSVGLAERVPYRGVRVPERSPEEIVEAYTLRLILESAAARMAALNISDENLESMQQIVEQMRGLTTLEDMSALRRLNRQFHLLIADLSGNSLLRKLCEMSSNQFPDWLLYEYMFRHPELLEASLMREYDEHFAILQAIKEGDPQLAEACTVAHLRNLRKELVEFLGIPDERFEAQEQKK